MANSEGNGIYSELKIINGKVESLKDDLSTSIDHLTIAVNKLGDAFDRFVHVAENSLPIKMVYWLLVIMILGLVGIEGVKSLPKFLM